MFTITDSLGHYIEVNLEEGGRIQFFPMFDFQDGGYVSYLDRDFKTYYAPDVAKMVDGVWDAFPQEQRHLLSSLLAEARDSVATWDLRDEVDKTHQRIVFDICRKRDVSVLELRK